MSIRAWCLAFAIGLVAELGQAQEAGDAPERQADTNQEQAESSPSSPAIPQPLSVEIVESQAATDARESNETEARQREIDDLIAQQGMNAATQAINEATQRMADDSREMTIATWVGVGLLVLTLILTLQANGAARQSVSVTREMMQDQLRAFVCFDAPGEAAPCYVVFEEGRLKVALNFMNAGQTPAKSVFFEGCIWVKFGAQCMGYIEIRDFHGDLAPRGYAHISQTLPGLKKRDFDARDRAEVFVSGRFYYRTLYDKATFTQIAIVCEVKAGKVADYCQYLPHRNYLT